MNRKTETVKRQEQFLRDGWEFSYDGPESYSPVRIPHDYVLRTALDPQLEQGGSQGYRAAYGIVRYRRELDISPKDGLRYYLDFGGVMENCTVYVNDRPACSQGYGYSAFRTEITPFLADGANTILVEIRAEAHPKDRWYSGGGIYRDVKLITTGQDPLDERHITVRTERDGEDAAVTVRAGDGTPFTASIGDNSASGAGEVRLQIKNARLWSADDPYLYELRIENDSDCVTMRIGIRTEELVPGKGLYINGRPIRLHGVCIHQDYAACGIAFHKELWRERLATLKEMGCNAIRASHHLYDSGFVELCDEMGFYLYEEAFDKWTAGAHARYYEETLADLAVMIERDRNHPSILFWGVGNEVENQGQDSMLAILRTLVDEAHRLDPSRPVCYAMNPHFKKRSGIDAAKVKDIQKFVDEADETEITDIAERIGRIRRIAEITDCVCCNYQEQWYPQIHDAVPDKLILGTEIFQYFLGDPEQMQNYTMRVPSLQAEEYPWCIGGFIWTGYDYLGEAGTYPTQGWSGSPIRTNGVRKPMFFQLQSYWTEEPMVHFAVLDYTVPDEDVKEHWDVPPYQEHWDFPMFRRIVIPYRIATNCDDVELYLNGKRFYTPRPADCRDRVIEGFIPWQAGQIDVYGIRNGKKAAEFHLHTPGQASRLVWEEAGTDQTLSVEPGEYRMFRIRCVDEDGNLCFRAQNRIQIIAEGPAETESLDNGYLSDPELYGRDSLKLYQGGLGVLVYRNGEGIARITASCEGLPDAVLTINNG